MRRGWKALRRHVAEAQRRVAEARSACAAGDGQVRAQDAAAVSSADRAVHGARKSLKRARAFARLLAPALGDQVAAEIDRRARDIGRGLAPLRDEVAVRAALDLVRARGGADSGIGEPSWAAVARACGPVADGSVLRGDAAAAVLDAAAADLVALRTLVRATGEPDASEKAWARGLRSLHRAARRAARAALAAPDDDERVHTARTKWKRLGVAVRVDRAAAPALVRPWVAEVEAVCALLGDDHDQVLLRDRLAAGVEDVAEEDLERLRAASRDVGAALRAEAMERLANLAAEPSNGFAERHRAYVASS